MNSRKHAHCSVTDIGPRTYVCTQRVLLRPPARGIRGVIRRTSSTPGKSRALTCEIRSTCEGTLGLHMKRSNAIVEHGPHASCFLETSRTTMSSSSAPSHDAPASSPRRCLRRSCITVY